MPFESACIFATTPLSSWSAGKKAQRKHPYHALPIHILASTSSNRRLDSTLRGNPYWRRTMGRKKPSLRHPAKAHQRPTTDYASLVGVWRPSLQSEPRDRPLSLARNLMVSHRPH